MRKRQLCLSDFFTGLVAALVNKGTKTLYDMNIDSALERLYPRIKEEANKQGLDLRFIIKTNSLDISKNIREELSYATQRGIVSWDFPYNNVLRLRVSPDEVPIILSSVPGNKEMYQILAEEFLEYH
jgi:hypothetical protein